MKTKTYSKVINIPELKEFSAKYPQFAGLASGEGKFLFDIIMKPETFIQAMVLTEYGMPAVTSVAELCYNEARKKRGFQFTGRVKQFIGAMIAFMILNVLGIFAAAFVKKLCDNNPLVMASITAVVSIALGLWMILTR